LREHRPRIAAAADRQLSLTPLGDGLLCGIRENLSAALVNLLRGIENLEPVRAHFGFSLCPPNW
jgi:hypothetical protein